MSYQQKVVFCAISDIAAVVSDNDGSAFITKAEFDSLKNNFQAQIDNYNQSIDSKIDGAIAAYLAGIKIESDENHLVLRWAANFAEASALVGGRYIDVLACFCQSGSEWAKTDGIIVPITSKITTNVHKLVHFNACTSDNLVWGTLSGSVNASQLETGPNRLIYYSNYPGKSFPVFMLDINTGLHHVARTNWDLSVWLAYKLDPRQGDMFSDMGENSTANAINIRIIDPYWSEIAGWDVDIQLGNGSYSYKQSTATGYIPILSVDEGTGNIDWKYYLAKNSDASIFKIKDWTDGLLNNEGLKNSAHIFYFVIKRGSIYVPITPVDGNIFRSAQQSWININTDVQAGDQLLFAFSPTNSSDNNWGTMRLVFDYLNHNP